MVCAIPKRVESKEKDQLPSEFQNNTWNISWRKKFSLYSYTPCLHFSRRSWTCALTPYINLLSMVCLETRDPDFIWKGKGSCSVVADSSRPRGLQPTRLLHPWDFPGKSTGVGCHRLHLAPYLLLGSSIPGWSHLTAGHWKFSLIAQSYCGHAILEWLSIFLCSIGVGLFLPFLCTLTASFGGRSVTKVLLTCLSPAQKQTLFPFISSTLHPQNILATGIICVGHDSLRGLISFYSLCKLSICAWIFLSSPAF